MKQGKSFTTFVIIALAVVLAVYLGFYALRAFQDPYGTTLVYLYTVNDSVEADGLIVRREQVLPAQSGIVEITRAEGERVGVGQEVALVYQNSQAQSNQEQLDALELEIDLLEYAISQSGGVDSAARLDEDILQALVDLRAACALGDYADLEEQVLEIKSDVLKRGYTYGDGLTSADLSAQLQDLRNQRSALQQQSAFTTGRVTAPQSGTFSNLVDGYESLLTPESVFQLTPSSLAELIDNPPAADSALGKLITSSRWYFAASLPGEAADRLSQGGVATLRFTGEFSRDVAVTVEQIGPAEGGQTLVIFSSDRYLSQITLLRHQTAELIFESWSGLRIPTAALRLLQEEQTDEETGQVTQTTRLGVYALVAGRVTFKEVEVLTEGEDYYVVRPVGTGRDALRAGEEIITRGLDLQDGQLLEF